MNTNNSFTAVLPGVRPTLTAQAGTNIEDVDLTNITNYGIRTQFYGGLVIRDVTTLGGTLGIHLADGTDSSIIGDSIIRNTSSAGSS